MLEWFVEAMVAESALKGKLIEEEEVETRPEHVSALCLDENVCLRYVATEIFYQGWLESTITPSGSCEK